MVAASATDRVPLGFVCGYPMKNGRGEMYTGDMFIKSAASTTLHGKAIQQVNERWNLSDHDNNVCKNKYTPFVTTKHVDPITKRVSLTVTRTYGCHFHSELRKQVISKYGERRGWEPFGQFSKMKAERAVKKLTLTNKDKTETVYSRPIGSHGSCVWKLKHKYDDIMEELHQIDTSTHKEKK